MVQREQDPLHHQRGDDQKPRGAEALRQRSQRAEQGLGRDREDQEAGAARRRVEHRQRPAHAYAQGQAQNHHGQVQGRD